MSKNNPTLQINAVKPRTPRCSVCGQEFGSEGFAHDLIDSFAIHVRRHHMDQNFLHDNPLRRAQAGANDAQRKHR
jgi:hypothetical protein